MKNGYCDRLLDHVLKGMDQTKEHIKHCRKGNQRSCRDAAHNITIIRDTMIRQYMDCIVRRRK